MWLLIVLVANLTGLNTALVDRYTTFDDCETHKEQFYKDFKDAYPGDMDYAFVCVKPTDKKEAS